MPSKNRQRADQLAFDQDLAESREKAKRLIMAGNIVYASGPSRGKPVSKPGDFLLPDTRLELLETQQYVSRGAYKLKTLLDACQYDPANKICLDLGASTGGFTDLLLQRGAAKVYAVDVGKNQLHEKLRADPRVVSIEGVNVRHAPAELLPEKADFLCADLSFISLTLVLPNCGQWLKANARAALLIKPQFELTPAEVGKGVVRDATLQKKAVAKISSFCTDILRWQLLDLYPAAIKGPKGNQEFMALFACPG